MVDIKAARKFARENDLSEAQLDVLRQSAAKYLNFVSGALHDGRVSTYGVMQATLNVLSDKQLITYVFELEEPARLANFAKCEALIKEAHTKFKACANPFEITETPDGPIAAWKDVLVNLSVAKTGYSACNSKCYKITERGREIAAQWKAVLGAVEE